MQISVHWSSRLECLADKLLESLQNEWKKHPDPFDKFCIVVNDSATANWLKEHFLLDCQMRGVIMNLEFVNLQEFVSDWLWAAIHKKAPRERERTLHPYSKEVLTWRIYDILGKAAPEGELKELLAYVRDDLRRRYSLAVQLAKLYDDYLNSRFSMLRKWEQGEIESDVPKWQVALYRQLVTQEKETYALDYEKALCKTFDARTAFDNGFPKYLGVHVFDIPFMPEATMCLLNKISEAMPITFWSFNPLVGDWLAETQSKQKSVEEHLLGALASGARSVLRAQCDKTPEMLEKSNTLVKTNDISLHIAYSPRRELEVIRDGLKDFFATQDTPSPRKALVLCADWETYAPLVDLVFPTTLKEKDDSKKTAYIPVTVSGKMPGRSQFRESLENLLAFRKNRFEVSAVFTLLRNSFIGEQFGLGADALDMLQDMVKKAYIHWGLNDDDVNRIIRQESKPEVPYQYTWQRGLDRLTAEMLWGFPENEYTLCDIGKPGEELHLCGSVEGDRATYLGALWFFIQKLKVLRDKLSKGKSYTADEFQKIMRGFLDDFYKPCDAIAGPLGKVRQAIRKLTDEVKTAGLAKMSIDVDVLLSAILSEIDENGMGKKSSLDAVTFAPLNCSNATPHDFVWICGLNNGKFPHIEYRTSFDQIGREPGIFDTTSREKDAFGLLKAVLSARKKLALSYVGNDAKSNDRMPPSVLLSDLMDYFEAKSMIVKKYHHPLQGYSRRYFQKVDELPPTYSTENETIASMLGKPSSAQGLVPFPLNEDDVTVIQLDDLVEFYAHPNHFLAEKCLNFKLPETKYDKFNDEECLKEAKLDKKHKEMLALEEKSEKLDYLLEETGKASPYINDAERVIDGFERTLKKELVGYSDEQGNKLTLGNLYKRFKETKVEEKKISISLKVDGRNYNIEIKASFVLIKMKKDDKEETISLIYMPYANEDKPTKNALWLRHLAVNDAKDGDIKSIVWGLDTIVLSIPKSIDNAEEKLTELVRKACLEKLPSDYPDFDKIDYKDDVLPDSWQTQDAMWKGKEIVIIQLTTKPRATKNGK